MKVLLLHQHFNTPEKGGPLRSYFIAKALAEKGARPVVITSHDHNRYQVAFIEGIEVHFLPVAYDNSFGFYRRIVSFLLFSVRIMAISRKFRDASVCYAISVPLTVGLAAIFIKKILRIPFVFEVGDLWPEAPVQMEIIRNKLIRKASYALERRIYEQAAAIVALSEPIKQYISEKIPEKEVHLVENMADTDFFQRADGSLTRRNKFGTHDKFVVSYIGAIGYANGLNFLLDCAEQCQRSGLQIHFIVCGAGGMCGELKNLADQLALKNVSFIPFQNRAGVKEVMDSSDACFICYRPEPVLETGSPNKYFEGLAAGKLIIVNFGGWIRAEIEKERCGIYVDRLHPEDFIAKVQPFLRDRNLLHQYQGNSRALGERKYSRAILAEKVSGIIINLSAKA